MVKIIIQMSENRLINRYTRQTYKSERWIQINYPEKRKKEKKMEL